MTKGDGKMTINTNEVWEPVSRVIAHSGIGHAESVIIGGQFSKLVAEIETREEWLESLTEVASNVEKERDELYSIALWAARRLPTEWYRNYLYDEIDKATGTESERV